MKAPVKPGFPYGSAPEVSAPMRLDYRRTAAAVAFLALLVAYAAPAAAQSDAGPGPVPSAMAVPAPAPADTTKRVTYVPDEVKAQLAEQAKEQVLEELRKEGWAQMPVVPGGTPADWTKRFRFYGDVRLRFERDYLPKGNANSGEFPDFNAINAGKPFDVNFVDLSTQEYLNVDQDRTRFRLRARVGMNVDIGQGFTVNVQIASGDGSTPVSTNQTLGGSAGDFSKYQIWLNQAYVRYEGATHVGGGLLEMGRFEYPFFNARDLLWSNENVNTDGFAGKGVLLAGPLAPFFIAGAFPLFNTQLSFPATSPAKFSSIDKWLFGGQLGTDWKISEPLNLKIGAAFYYYSNVTGIASAPCDTNLSYTSCNTDITRPSFAQTGNTYRVIRTPSAAALLAEATNPLTPRYQYFGLASKFNLVSLAAKFDAIVAAPLTLTLEAEFVWNAGFSASKVAAVALNNLAPCATGATNCNRFAGGSHAGVGRLTFGHPLMSKQWSWNVSFAYLYIESDAVLDAFTNPDFFIGGANIQGYIAEAQLALADNVLFRLRWLSQDNIGGPTLKADVLQIDLWARF